MTTKTGNSKRNILHGTSVADVLSGLGGNDDLYGLGGKDKLDGGTGNDRLDGGTNADTMQGGSGNDTFIVDNAGDKVSDTSGTDTVRSSITFHLSDSIENLTLTGSHAISGFGTSGANTLIGNSAANTLDGKGGADIMRGGAGNDVYVVDNIHDKVSDSSGIDRIKSSVSFTLPTNVENLTLTGTGQINGNGNSADNKIAGNEASNILDGKAGNDSLSGGGGGDTLKGGAGADQLDGGGGSDVVSYAASSAGVVVGIDVNGTLTGAGGDAAGDHGTSIERVVGSAFADEITLGVLGSAFGGDGNDTIQGSVNSGAGVRTMRGDGGNDTLIGAGGSGFGLVDEDHFWLQYDRGIDTVDKFQTGQDKFVISAAEFHFPAATVSGTLPNDQFLYSANDYHATTPDQRLIFDVAQGILWADLDGSGSQFGPVPIADLSGQSWSQSDFLIIA